MLPRGYVGSHGRSLGCHAHNTHMHVANTRPCLISTNGVNHAGTTQPDLLLPRNSINSAMGLLGAIFDVVRRLVCATEASKTAHEPERPPYQPQTPGQHHPGAYPPQPVKPVQPLKPSYPPAHHPPKPPSPGRIQKRYVSPQLVLQGSSLKENPFPRMTTK